MNRKRLFILIIIIFAILSVFIVFFQKSKIDTIRNSVENTNTTGTDLVGATNIRSFTDTYKNVANQTNKSNKAKVTGTPRPKPTPVPLPYPRIEINYSLKRTDSIRGISPGANKTFILVSVSIKNYGYKYFDVDPRKFRLEPLEPRIDISTGNMLDAVLPNNSQTQGDLLFLADNKKKYRDQLTYVNGGFKIIYKIGAAQNAGGISGNRPNVINNNYD